MAKEMGYFVVLEGIDGSGKTTLAKKAVELLGSSNVVFCTRKTIAAENVFIESQMKKVASLMWTENNGELDHLLPTHYWIYLQAVWYSLLSNFVIQPLLNENKIVIVDGWYYKFVARLLTQDEYNFEYLDTIFSHVIQPDLTILLDVDINLIWNRKQDFKLYELGAHQGYQKLNKESFVEFQSKTFMNLKQLSDRFNWKNVVLNTSDIEENANSIISFLKREIPCLRT